jgi:uncharacterized membrane protein YoaK (UPF0700 family)
MNALLLLAQNEDTAAAAAVAGFGLMSIVCVLVVYVLFSWLMFWKVFEKAGQPPVMCLVPIANLYFLLMIAKRPAWWLLLFFIPIVSFVIAIIVAIDIAKKFGQEPLFALGLILLPIVFYPILGFGSATYNPDAA